ncbi:hypothetical protein [Terrarubrum flagellatum]|uniref:hypothetical protein n=1 Tax=Terrirubrum flagellatum TaxID=2895980 RepID=UPI003145362B
MTNLEIARRSALTIDPHKDIGAIADADIVDDDAAETLNGAVNAGSADASVVACIPARRASSTDALISGPPAACSVTGCRHHHRANTAEEAPPRWIESVAHCLSVSV